MVLRQLIIMMQNPNN